MSNGNNLPTDAEVREAYATIQDQENGEEWTSARLEAEFDAWLAAHDARVKAEAWAEGAYAGYDDCKHDGDTPNPYIPDGQ